MSRFACCACWKRLARGLILTGSLIHGLSLTLLGASYQCTHDAYIDCRYPNDNFGGCDRLLVANNQEPTRVLMKFDIPEWVESSNIEEARIVLLSAPWTGGGGGETGFEVFPLTRPWVEGSCARYNDPIPDDGATWYQYEYDSDPGVNQWDSPGGDYDGGLSVTGVFPLGNDWGPFFIDVTALMTNSLNDLREYGFLIKHPSEDQSGGWQNFAGKDSSGYDPPRHPFLEIDYLIPPPNNSPYIPASPSPPLGASGVAVNTVLSWGGGDPDPNDTVTYDVYFGTTGALAFVSDGQTANTYDPGILAFSGAYEWMVVAQDNYGEETAGPIWSFTTTESGVSYVYPESGSPFYFRDEKYLPRPVYVYIKGEGTTFYYPQTQVGFGDEGITVLWAIPFSSNEIWAKVIITESARLGFHDLTVTTGNEASVGIGLFEVKKFWRQEDYITVVLGSLAFSESISELVSLWGLPVHDFQGKESLRLSDIVEKSAMTETPNNYYYNLIATDGYSLERGIIVGGWGTGLPTWSDMQKGYLYPTESFGLLCGWEEDSVGGQIGHCYNVKWMDGGVIEIREQDMNQ
ncbi:MAG: DNRLRE domain-containing protein [Thermodesulfobacteriota bacterium]|nr:DNRLRE domain-containing protein [Thermodesulfobacteriota bacterium]